MIAHLRNICAAEGIAAEPEALALIARVAEARCATRCRCSTRGLRMAAMRA